MSRAGLDGTHSGRIVVLAVVAVLVIAGGAAGLAAGSGPGDGATISPEVTDATGEQVVVVYFGTDTPVAAATGNGSEVSADHLRDRASSDQAALDRYAEATPGVTVLDNFWLGNMAVVRIDHGRADVRDLASIDGVEHVGPNAEVTVDTSSAVTGPTVEPDAGVAAPAGTETGMGTLSSHYTYGLEQINAPEVWESYGTQGSGIVVTVLDTGVDADHPDIDLAAWGEWGDRGNEVDTEPQDYDSWGHGTHVSGTVAGGDASGTQIGVAPDVTLRHGAVLTNCSGRECVGTLSQIAAGMQWAVDNDADVLSLSLGGPGYTKGFIDMVRDAESAGTLVVGAIGNAGEGTSSSPGNVYDTLSVGAADSSEEIAGFSSGEEIDTESAWGDDAPREWPQQYVVPSVSAPGVFIHSTFPGGEYRSKSGTSMATPHVSGAAALLQAATSRELTVPQIERALVETADHPDGDTQGTRYGDGIIDVKAAADYASGSLPANFEVTIDGTNSPIGAGETLTVDATVENTGEESATQTIVLDVPVLGGDSTSVTLSPGESTSVSLAVDTGSGEADEYTATVESDDDSDARGVSVEGPANFAVAIDGTNSPVAEGETLSVDVDLANSGDTGGTQTVALTVGGQQRDATEVTLAGGESTTATLAWTTQAGSAGEYTATVASPAADAETGVRIVVGGSQRPPPVVGDAPPQDLNGDGLYRDVDGDGAFTVADVQAFFQQRDSDAVQDNVDAFDFRTDGALSIGDVQILFQDFLERR
jgi:subtilisin family serine protease